MENLVKSLVREAPTPVKAVLWLIGVIFFGFIGYLHLSIQIPFSLEGQQAEATVDQFDPGRKGGGTVSLSFQAEEKQVKTAMGTFSLFQNPKPGDRIHILYLPGTPGMVQPDSFLQRFWLPLLNLALAGAGLFKLVLFVRSLFVKDSTAENAPDSGSGPEGLKG